MTTKNYEINAKDKSLGRVASQVAILLRGKNLPEFKFNVVPPIKAKILNVDKIKLTGAKFHSKTYKRYSGYAGGLKTVKFETMFKKDPQRIFRKVLEGMLPKNRLRKQIIKNLVFG
jgi:large subunit ribosomal protein L13